MVEEFLKIPAVWSDHNLPYLPRPNFVDVVFHDTLPPLEYVSTAFVVPFFDDGSALFARNTRRGIEIPGGHINVGETAEMAAKRECLEETGALVDEMKVIGYLRMMSHGSIPPGYQYPHPLGFQVYFAGRVVERKPYAANDECFEPRVLRPSQVRTDIGPLRESHRLFHAEGYRKLFLDNTIQLKT